jgi:hypothetical protein
MSVSDKGIIIVILVVCVVGFAVIVGFVFSPFVSRYPYTDIVLAENVSISSQWQEIDVTDKIAFRGDDRFVAIKLESPFIGNFEKQGIEGPDGQIFHPEVIFVDNHGIEYALTYRGFLGRMRPKYGDLSKLPPGRVYRKMRIRSAVPFQASKITWTYYYTFQMR